MRLRNGLLAAALAVAAFPAAASAAPDFQSELSADKTTFHWEGEGSGVPVDAGLLEIFLGQDSPFACGAATHECDFTLLDIKHPGALTVTAAADGAETTSIPEYGDLTIPDIDLYLYKANDAGEIEGDDLSEADGAGGGSPETFTVNELNPGKYVVVVSFFLADGATYKADAGLATSVPPTPAAPVTAEQPKPSEPAPTTTEPAPQQSAPAQQQQTQPAAKKESDKKKLAKKKKACQKKAKKIKNKKKRKKALKKCAKIKR